MKSKLALSVVFGICLTGGAIGASATILTFDVNNQGLAQPLPDGYGDNVNQAVVAGITYLQGNGFTPNVLLDFLPDANATLEFYTVWEEGYAYVYGVGGAADINQLPNALGHQLYDVPGEIVFTPAAGFGVLLNSFDIGTWDDGVYDTDIRIWDSNGSRATPNLFSFNQTLNPAVVYSPLQGAVSSDGPIHMYINNLGSTGLDNLNFDQYRSTTPDAIPVPATIPLLGLALAALGYSRRKR